ncbi:MAG: DUF2007 domain-containing protein [Crocinitomicaceae bacterium]|nr:DUF2007 domain-containing protein [Crocinitomicaceae bacterium]
MENRVIVYTTTSEQEAYIVRDRLEAEGIDAMILDVKDHVSEVSGGFEIHVLKEQEDQAKLIVPQSAE